MGWWRYIWRSVHYLSCLCTLKTNRQLLRGYPNCKGVKREGRKWSKIGSRGIYRRPTCRSVSMVWSGVTRRVLPSAQQEGRKRGKIPTLIEECVFLRSTPSVSAMHPQCIQTQIPLFSLFRPTLVLPDDKSSLCSLKPWPIPDTSTLNIGPPPILMLDFRSRSLWWWGHPASVTARCIQVIIILNHLPKEVLF